MPGSGTTPRGAGVKVPCAEQAERCCWYTPAGLGHTACRSRHSGDGTECRDRQAECTRPAGVYWQHRSACSAHGTLTQAPRGVVPEPGTRATGRVLCSAGHGHRVLSIPVQDRPRGRSDRPYRGSRCPYSENERSLYTLDLYIAMDTHGQSTAYTMK